VQRVAAHASSWRKSAEIRILEPFNGLAWKYSNSRVETVLMAVGVWSADAAIIRAVERSHWVAGLDETVNVCR
jgi:hypothetical protein